MNKNAFELEWQKTIRKLSDKNASAEELKYFLNLAAEYARFSKDKPRVIMLGHYFPDEIIRAMGIDFYYVFGGSYESTQFKNVNLPKDADDTTRSVLGILKSDGLKLNKDDVLLIPLFNDSMKKLKAYVSDSVTAISYEVPSDTEDSVKRFADETERVTAELKKHFKKGLSSKKLKEQCEISKKAAEAFGRLEMLYKEKAIGLTASALVFIANSYYLCKDKKEWILHIERLIDELCEKDNPTPDSRPDIMLLGSPIYPPNYKVLFAIEDMRMRLHTVIHPNIEHIKAAANIDIKSVCVKYLAMQYLKSDISPIFINNSALINSAANAIKSGEIKGIAAHIIKGQIGYDYECKLVEKTAAEFKIPLNRIETVYAYQDIEQIGLKLQAFSEILNP